MPRIEPPSNRHRTGPKPVTNYPRIPDRIRTIADAAAKLPKLCDICYAHDRKPHICNGIILQVRNCGFVPKPIERIIARMEYQRKVEVHERCHVDMYLIGFGITTWEPVCIAYAAAKAEQRRKQLQAYRNYVRYRAEQHRADFISDESEESEV